MPNGRTEEYTVNSARYYTGHGGAIPDIYEVTYEVTHEREGAQPHQSQPHQPGMQPITVRISDSPQSHFNIDSEDYSISTS